MKIFNALLIPPLLLGLGPVIKLSVSVSSYSFGPFENLGPSSFFISIKNTSMVEGNVEATLYQESSLMYKQPVQTKIVNKLLPNKAKFVNFSLDTSAMRDDGITYSLYICMASNRRVLFDKSFHINPLKKMIVDIESLQNRIVTFNSYSGKFNNNEFVYDTEVFDFSLHQDPYVFHKYLYFDLSQFSFLYSEPKLPRFNTSNLTIKDSKNIFKFMPHVNGEIKLDLDLFTNGNNIMNFKIKNPLFVNPKTMEMSLTKYDNFLPTNNLYFPLGFKEEIKDIFFTIDATNIGQHGIDFYYQGKCDFIKNFIGECSNSDLCILGGKSND